MAMTHRVVATALALAAGIAPAYAASGMPAETVGAIAGLASVLQ